MKKPLSRTKPGRKEHWFSTDRPIESARDDLLGRSAFAARLAASISTWDGENSLVIALHGGWGTGKTSVKNMVLEKLRSSRSRGPHVVEFSPWQVSGTGTLVAAFFHELGIALGVGKKRNLALLNKFLSYAKPLTFIGHAVMPFGAAAALADPLAGSVILATGAAAKQSAQILQAGAEASKAAQHAKAKSLTDLKRDLESSLRSLARPILVVIDDIDRLTTEEILQVFQLVKVNADFPNLVYLLLFERGIVCKALDQVSGNRGHEFLQKIVQVEFSVPQAHRRSIERVLFSELDRLIEHEAVKPLFDERHWGELYVDGLSRYFQNLRHIYRFLGSFAFHVAQFKCGRSFEVNPVDLIGVEVLRVFEPGLYEQLPSSKRLLTRDEGRVMLGRIEQKEVEAAIDQLMNHVPAERQAQVKAILGTLFPPISGAFDNDEGVSGYKQQWLREHRVCHFDLFDKFFALVVGEGDLSQAELDRLLRLASDRNGFVAECRALLRRGLLEVAFDRLDAYKDQIRLESMPALIGALCDLGEDLPQPKGGPFDVGVGTYAWRLIYFGLLRERDSERRLAILKEAITTSPGIALPLDIVSMEERTDERRQQGYNFIVEENGLNELKGICVSKIRAAAATDGFRNSPHLRGFLSLWFRWGDRTEVQSWVATRVKTPSEAVWLLRVLLIESTSTGTGGTRVHHHVHLPLVEQFVDLKYLTDLTADLEPDGLEGLDKIAVKEFRKASKRRADGRPDDDWKWRIREPD